MHLPHPANFFFYIFHFLSICLQVVDSAHVVNPSNPETVPVFGTWPNIPFTIAINQTTPAPAWLRFSNGGRTGTVQQGLVLAMLSANLAATFANSTSTVDIPNSSVENRVQNVFILFQLNQRTLSMKSYSAAMESMSAFVKQWGAKEMDFEVGSGPQNSTAGGVFQVRLSRNPLPGDTGNKTTGAKSPAFFSMVIPPQQSPSRASNPGPIASANLTQSSVPSPNNGTMSRLATGTGTRGQTFSSSAINRTTPIAQGGNNTFTSAMVSGPLSSVPALMAAITSSPVAASNFSGVSAFGNGSSTFSTIPGSRIVPHRDGHGDAAALAAGAAAGAGAAVGAVAAGLGGAPAAPLPGAAPAAAAAADAAANDSQQPEDNRKNDTEDGNEDGNQSLSLGNQAKSQSQAPNPQTLSGQLTLQSQAPASQTFGNQLTTQSQALISQTLGVQSTPGSQVPGSQNLTQVASTVASIQASRTWAPTGFFTTFAPTQNASMPVANMTITACPTCTGCPGFQVNVADPPSNSTSHDDDNDDGNDDEDGNAKKRALAGRFDRQRRDATVRDYVGSDRNKCYVTPFTMKPAYPSGWELREYAKATQTPASLTGFYQTAKYWAVASDVPKGSCEAPSWSLKDTADIISTDPAINPQGWTIGGSGDYATNIDHLYEVQLLNMFFYARMIQAPGSQYSISCDDIQKVFDEVDDRTQPELGTRLNVTFNKLASYANPEFLGMSELLNTKKSKFFGFKVKTDLKKGDAPIQVTKDPDNTNRQLAQFALTLSILNDPPVWSLFETTNTRIYQQFQRVDQLIEYRANNNCADKFLDPAGELLAANWAESYQSWMNNKITTINVALQIVAKKAVASIPTENSPKFKVLPAQVANIAAIWAPRLANLLGAFPVEQMKLPALTEWPAPSPANFGPDDCHAVQTMAPIVTNSPVNTSAPATTAPGSSSFISSPVTVVSTWAISPATTAAANPSNGDPCGPQHQDTPNYPNTCDAKVDLVQTPSAYGVNCSSENPSAVQPNDYRPGQQFMAWHNCLPSAQNICNGINNMSNPTGYWIWSYQSGGCAVGVFLPSYAGSAPSPSPERCKTLIFEAIVDSCSTTTIPSNMGSVNVVTNPSYLGTDTSQGAQVNAGYPSYIVSSTMPQWMGIPPAPWPVPDYGGDPWKEGPPEMVKSTYRIAQRNAGRGINAVNRGFRSRFL